MRALEPSALRFLIFVMRFLVSVKEAFNEPI